MASPGLGHGGEMRSRSCRYIHHEFILVVLKLVRFKPTENLNLSSILIDGDSKRAFNFSSISPLSVRRHWLRGEIQIRFAMVVPDGGGGEALVHRRVVVSCREDEDKGDKDVTEEKDGHGPAMLLLKSYMKLYLVELFKI